MEEGDLARDVEESRLEEGDEETVAMEDEKLWRPRNRRTEDSEDGRRG